MMVTGIHQDKYFALNRAEIYYRQFQFTYQGNGYFKNMGSGYLSARGIGSSSGTNVELSSSATLWQVLPDGAGGYYIVPNGSYTSCLDLTQVYLIMARI